MFSSWLFGRKARKPETSRPGSRPRRTVPRLEALEDRLAPAGGTTGVLWVGPAGGSWSTAANFKDLVSGVNRVPTADDAVVFDTSKSVGGVFGTNTNSTDNIAGLSIGGL